MNIKKRVQRLGRFLYAKAHQHGARLDDCRPDAELVCNCENRHLTLDSMKPPHPIGVFDSGIGGLTVLRHIRARLPATPLIYIADSAHTPYGGRPREYVETRSVALTDFLLARGAAAVVIACNTATAAAAATLRSRYDLPIIGIEPALKPAVAQSKTGVVGILATAGTLASDKFDTLLRQYGKGARIITQPCPGLVEQVERGDVDGPRTLELLKGYVSPLLQAGADTLVLGCTHYPFLTTAIERLGGPGVAVVEPGAAVARELARRLQIDDPPPAGAEPGRVEYWTSGDPAGLENVAERLLGWEVTAHRLPDAVAGIETVIQGGLAQGG